MSARNVKFNIQCFLKFNINGRIKVKLTDHGRHLHYQDWTRWHYQMPAAARKYAPYKPPTEDADGWSCWTAWHLMEIFGPHMSIAAEPPFETDVLIQIP